MPSPSKRSATFHYGRLVVLLLAALLMPAYTAAAGACGQAEPTALSDQAQTILSLNQRLSGVSLSPQTTGARTSTPLRSDRGVLQTRAQLIRDLMQTHPDEVRSVVLPAATAARLLAADPANAAYVEHDASVTGDLGAIEVDAFDQGTGQRVYALHDPSTAVQLAVHSVASSDLQPLLHRRVVVAGLQLGNDLLAETLTSATAANLRSNAMHSLTLQAAVVPASNTSLTCATTGQQRTAVLLLQFPNNSPAFPGSYGTAAWWQQAIAGQGKSVNGLWSEMTAGQTYASADVYGPLTLPQSYGCADYLPMRSAALALASNTIDLSRYTRIVLGFPASSCTFGGLADIGCNGGDSIVPHPYSVVWMPIVTTYTASTGVWASLAHELGHNLGLNHANTLDFGAISLGPMDFQSTNPGTVYGNGASTAAGAVTATDTEYGDVFSVMGNPWSAGPGPYSAEHRAKLLDWIPSSGTTNGLGTVTTAGTYTIQPASSGTGLRSLRVLRDAASASWLWLEYRNGGTPFDAANLAAVNGQNASQGAVVHYENGYGDHDKTYQLDMTPASRGNNFADGALVPGSTWTDPYSSLSLAVDSVSSAGLSVSVKYDSLCATFSAASSPIGPSGGSGTITVTAPATCAWTASSNAAWMTLSGTSAGTGNGSFTWTASANTGSGQRITYLTVGRSSQRLLQLGRGANVVALSPANATVDPGSSVVLSLALQDSNGVADLQNVELDAHAAGAPPCTVFADLSSGAPYLFLLDPTTNEFTSGIAAGSTASVSAAGCTLSGRGSGLVSSGGNITLALNLTFPASWPGVRGLFATVNAGTELPVGILNVGTVTAPQTNPPSTNPPTNMKATTTTLTGAPGSSLPGSMLLLDATVSGGNAAIPTGVVTLLDGTSILASTPLDGSGRANLSTAALPVGTHNLQASYSGDSNFAGSVSAIHTVVVAQAATTTTLTSSAATVSVGGSATLTLSVAHSAGTTTPGGTVTLRDGTTVLTTSALQNASASFPLSGLAAGMHTYVATYSGDVTYLASSSNVVAVTAGKLSATFTVAMTPTALAGAPVRVTVTSNGGTAAGAPAPTGTVELQEGGRSLGSIPLTNGTGTLALGNLSTGSHTFTGSYSGDSIFATASNITAAVTVVDFSVTGPGTPADITVTSGALTGNAATVTLTPGPSGFPLNVAFLCNGAPSGATCTVSPGTVTPGGKAVPVTVTITTTARTSPKYTRTLAGCLSVPLLGILLCGHGRRSAPRLLAMLIALFAITASVTGCGSGVTSTASTDASSSSSPAALAGTPAGKSTLSVQAVASSDGSTLTHTAAVTLQVN